MHNEIHNCDCDCPLEGAYERGKRNGLQRAVEIVRAQQCRTDNPTTYEYDAGWTSGCYNCAEALEREIKGE